MSEEAPAVVGIAVVCIDSDRPRELARWWSRLLGGEVEADPDGDATLHVPGGPTLDFLHTEDPRVTKNRLHLDLRSSDFDAAVQQALALGATRADDIYAAGRWQVLRDPEGNELCILRPRPAPGR